METEHFIHTEKEQLALDLAITYHQAGNFPEAQRIYHSVLTTSPNHPMALHYLGLVTHQIGNAEQAVELIKKSVAVMPDYEEAHCNLAKILVQMGRADEAETYCRKALALEPEMVNAHSYLGKALGMLGRFDEAVESCRNALALDPNQTDAYETLGSALCNLGRLDKAVEAYQQAISVDPDSALIHNNLGSTFHILKEFDQSVESYEKAIALKPNYIMAYQNLANVLRDMGRIDEAVSSLQKALEIEPNLPSIRHNLNALLGNTTDNAPREYVEELFDPFADQFDDHLENKLEYKMPALLKTALLDLKGTEGTFETVVDLGCGTGLVGVAFRDLGETLVGIDLSKNMVRLAQDKGVYDQLYVDDLVSGLNRIDGEIDLFVSADVFIYVGSLHETFAAVKKHAAPNAVFVFSTEHTETTDQFVLQNTSRYAHSKTYIEDLANVFGFRLEHFEQTNLRKENSGWIPGAIYVLKSV